MPSRLRHLARDGELDLAGELRILADLERLDIVPEPFAVAPCLRRASPAASPRNGRRRALSEKSWLRSSRSSRSREPGPIGGRRHRATAGLAANDLDVKMIDRHRDRITDTAKRTSERRISAPSLEKISGGIIPSQPVLTTSGHCCRAFDYHLSINTWGDFDAKAAGFRRRTEGASG